MLILLTNDSVFCPLALGFDGADIMPCIVNAGPEEGVHGRVNDDEWLRRALLHPDDLRQQGACIAYDHPAGLEPQPDSPVRCYSTPHVPQSGRAERAREGQRLRHPTTTAQLGRGGI